MIPLEDAGKRTRKAKDSSLMFDATKLVNVSIGYKLLTRTVMVAATREFAAAVRLIGGLEP